VSTSRRILQLREQHHRTPWPGGPQRTRVLERQLSDQPVMSVKDVRALIRTTFAGANQIVQRLVDLKLLAEITGQARHRRFLYDAYVRPFDEE